MMIYKYPLDGIKGSYGFIMPLGAEILSFQVQGHQTCLWALVDPDAEPSNRYFILVGTGHQMPDYPCEARKFIGTVQQESGRLVWHLFELVNPAPKTIELMAVLSR